MKPTNVRKKYLFVMIILLLTTQIFSQTKSVKVLLDDGTTSYYPVSEVTKLTFEEDACDGVSTVTYDGKTYSTVQIGTQCWLEQNLDVGIIINSYTGGSNSDGEQSNDGIIEKYCYNNHIDGCHILGGLYRWAEALQYQNGATNTANPSYPFNQKGICPVGWYIPTKEEFATLKTQINNGHSLKANAQGLGTNTSGFSALLAGSRSYYDGLFYSLGYSTGFWSYTGNVEDPITANVLFLDKNNSEISLFDANKQTGFSVRCLKD